MTRKKRAPLIVSVQTALTLVIAQVREESPQHLCHAEGCVTVVPLKLLMCRQHWMSVPKAIRDRVRGEYVPGQEVRKDPTRSYLDAMDAAIEAVAKKEGRR